MLLRLDFHKKKKNLFPMNKLRSSLSISQQILNVLRFCNLIKKTSLMWDLPEFF